MSKSDKNAKKWSHYKKKKDPEKKSAAVTTEVVKSAVPQMKKTEKLSSKAIGLKSVIVADGRVVVTSFADSKTIGDYKCANIEKITDTKGNEIKSTPRMFTTDVDEKNVTIRKRNPVAEIEKVPHVLDNPAANKNIGRDYVGIKGALEKEFFGKEFSCDNLHVQIAYNIIDIKKILSTYVGNVINIFYNINRYDNDNTDAAETDIIGMLHAGKSYDQWKEECGKNEAGDKQRATLRAVKMLLCGTTAYYKNFGTVFLPFRAQAQEVARNVDKVINEQKFAFEHNYNILRMLSLLRQITTHGVVRTDEEKTFAESALFCLDNVLSSPSMKPLKTILDRLYGHSVNMLNKGFCTNSVNNLEIISQIYRRQPKDALVRLYYRLVMLKDELNLGVNVKHLRELIVERKYSEVLDKEYDLFRDGNSVLTYRSKLYTVMNFILFKALLDDDEKHKDDGTGLRERMVAELRVCAKDEERKEAVYKKYAEELWGIVGDLFEDCKNEFERQKELRFKVPAESQIPDLVGKIVGESDFVLSAKGTDYFVKMLYLLCKFLDGKEINELLCAMINKFDNIRDLIETAEQSGLDVSFSEAYAMFENSRKIGRDLRVVKNIAAKEFAAIKRDKAKPQEGDHTYVEKQYLDALAFLGKDIVCSTLNAHGEPEWTEDYKQFRRVFFETERRDAHGGIKFIGKDPVMNHQVRNFVLNNVLKSKWYFYVVKYNSPAKCRKLMQNETLLRLVLDDLPDSLVRRYYKTVTAREILDVQQAKEELVKRLLELSADGVLKGIAGMSESDFKDQSANTDKERKKAIIQLYLMVAYQITKNLVKINTRFNIAFSVYERDYFLKTGKKMPKVATDEIWLHLTEEYIAADEKIYAEWKKNADAVLAKNLPAAERNPALRANDKLLKGTHFKTKWIFRLKNNLDELKAGNFTVLLRFRNWVAHLNVVNQAADLVEGVKADSFYGVYCYCLQKLLLSALNDSKAAAEILNDVKKTGKYCKDLMWLINLPFAYNLARYKNLSNEYLFNERDGKAVPEKAGTEKA